MMQQHHSTIDQIFVYDNITEKAKYDLMYERQRVDRFHQEWKKWKWDANSNTTSQRRQSPPQHPTMNKMDKMNTSNTSTTIHQLQQENERLHQQLHDVSTQLQQSRTAAPPEELSTLKTSSAPVLPASETAQQRQALELSLHEYKEYCKELEQQMEEQRLEHSNTVDILQQQVILLQESLQTTRQRLVTRDAEMDQMSSTFEQYKRSHHPLILQAPLSQHQQQYDANPEFPISPLSMTDSMVEGGRGGADQRCHHHFDTTTSTTITPPTTTTPHTDTIVVIPQPQQHNQEHIFETTTTVPAAATTTENTMSVGVMPCSSVASSASIVRTNMNHYNHNTASSKSIISVTSSTTTLPYPRNATTMPQIRSDVDRAKAIEKLEYERIHNAMIVQQLRQSVLLQQQQQQQVHCPPQPSQQ